MTSLYTAEEVSRHNQEKDLWIVMNGNVYDLTKFLKEHPGGEEVLLGLAGGDGTECFDDIGHSAEALQLRDTYKIGVLSDKAPAVATGGSKGVPYTPINDDTWEYQPPKTENSSGLPVLLAIGVVIYALVLYYFWY